MAEIQTQPTKFVETSEDLSWVLVSPRMTEKAARISEGNVYTFNVDPRANKIQIKRAIKAYYKVAPLAVNIIVGKQKKVTARGRRGTKAGYKKAMVTLKKGDTIALA